MTRTRIPKLLAGCIAAMALVACMGLPACGGADQQASDTDEGTSSDEPAATVSDDGIRVLADESLEDALDEIEALFVEKHPDAVFAEPEYAASGDLASQAPSSGADLLFTSSTATMDRAETNEGIDSTTRVDLLEDDLVVIGEKGGDVKLDGLDDLEDLVSDGAIVAIGDAATVPAGKHANQALASVGLYTNAEGVDGDYADSIVEGVLLAEKVAGIVESVSTGTADIGFVYASDLERYKGIEALCTIPSKAHRSIVYPAAVCADAPNAEEAASFLDFCQNSKKARKVWKSHGFDLASTSAKSSK